MGCALPGAPVKFRPNSESYNVYLASKVMSKSAPVNASLLLSTLAEMEEHRVPVTPLTFNPHAWLAYTHGNWKLADVRACMTCTRASCCI